MTAYRPGRYCIAVSCEQGEKSEETRQPTTMAPDRNEGLGGIRNVPLRRIDVDREQRASWTC
jgi:hypothetical protein